MQARGSEQTGCPWPVGGSQARTGHAARLLGCRLPLPLALLPVQQAKNDASSRHFSQSIGTI